MHLKVKPFDLTNQRLTAKKLDFTINKYSLIIENQL